MTSRDRMMAAIHGEPFDRFRGSIQVENGVFKSGDFYLSGSLLRAQGAGFLNLVRREISYDLTADITGLPTTRIGIQGPLRAPTVRVDKGSLAASTAAQIIRSPLTVGQEVLDLGEAILAPGSGAGAIGREAGALGSRLRRMGESVLDSVSP